MIRLTTAAFLIIASPSLLAADGVGKVLLSFGKNHAITAEGELRLLKRKSEIFDQETLQTGPRGRLQVRFSDDSMLSLKPNTRYAIQQYEFNKAAPTESKAFYKLIKGGMRTISGKIGKVDREDYKLETVVATIGIRGTEFEVLQSAEGMWLGVSDGKVFAESDQTSELIGSGGYAFVGNDGQLVVLQERPAELDQSTASDGDSEEEQGGSGGESSDEEDAAAEGAAGDDAEGSAEGEIGEGAEADAFADDSVAEVSQHASAASDTASDPGEQSQQGNDDEVAAAQEEKSNSSDNTDNTDTDTKTDTSTDTGSTDSGTDTDSGTESLAGTSVNADAGSRVRMTSFAQGNTSSATGLVVTAENGQKLLKVDKTNKLFTGYDLKSGNGFLSGSTGSSCLPSSRCTLQFSGKTSDGSFGTDGDIYYGRWNKAALTSASENGSDVSIAAPLHYVFSESFSGTDVIAARTGSVRYDLSNATKPTSLDSDGNLQEGTLNSAKIILSYDDMKVLDAAMAISMEDGRKLDMSLLSEMSLNASGEFVAMSMSGNCTGGGCTDSSTDLTQVSMNGTWAFDLVGNQAQQLMSEYVYNASSSAVTPFSVTGVAVLNESPKEGFAVAYLDGTLPTTATSAATSATTSATSSLTHLRGESGAAVADYQNRKVTTVDVSGADVITFLSVTDTDATADDGCNPCTFDSDGISTSEGTAALKDSAFTNLDDAKVSWGRWDLSDSATLSITDGRNSGTVTDPRGPLHFVYSGDLTPYDTIKARTGTATYSWANGTTPTLADNTVSGLDGTVDKLDVSVNFDSQNVTAVDMGLSFSNGSSAYSVSANMASDSQTGLQNLVSGSDDLRLNGSLARTLSASTPENIQMDGRMTLQFVGEKGQGAITSFGLQEQGTTSGIAVSGAGLLKEGAAK